MIYLVAIRCGLAAYNFGIDVQYIVPVGSSMPTILFIYCPPGSSINKQYEHEQEHH